MVMSVSTHSGLQANTMLDGERYRIVRVIASSELSIVYSARETRTGIHRIVKEFFPQALVMRDLDGRTVLPRMPSLKTKFDSITGSFQNEALLLGSLEHPNIVKLVGHIGENGTFYTILEKCRGISLERAIRKKLIRSKAVFYEKTIPSIIGALAYLHDQGILHRDIKPANLIVASDGQVKLIDFGSAVHQSDTDRPIFTSAGYSPLEFYSASSSQGPVSDLYSLGATLYYCLCGEAPVEVSRRFFNDPLETVFRKKRGKVTPKLSHAIRGCLSVKAEQRWTSLQKVSDAVKAEALLWKIAESLWYGLRAKRHPYRNGMPQRKVSLLSLETAEDSMAALSGVQSAWRETAAAIGEVSTSAGPDPAAAGEKASSGLNPNSKGTPKMSVEVNSEAGSEVELRTNTKSKPNKKTNTKREPKRKSKAADAKP
ncbi:serine/threonine-protein kinase [Paenibacillus sp. FJAT-26967]|uniref:serine/threonine protein kinase n=1 Tax=Paenibacillus sp. FJAT-26967 TaxID=1729690 RepID=UPI0008396505|nr:serine/threonine-protein kinase [Paenibacillus sp. FJAT-26967]